MATATAISSTGCTAYTELVNTRPRSGTLGVYGGKYRSPGRQDFCANTVFDLDQSVFII